MKWLIINIETNKKGDFIWVRGIQWFSFFTFSGFKEIEGSRTFYMF